MSSDQRSINRILKVNHSGEYGAIRIYKAQILAARLFYRDLLPELEAIIQHEVEHCRRFRAAMVPRGGRPCRALWLWSSGGYVLGLLTGLLGRNMIMVCTEAVEEAVHQHMNDQIVFLMQRDPELKDMIAAIREEEMGHLAFAKHRVRHNGFTRNAARLIMIVTDILIWLSTQGESSRMKRDLRSA